MNNSAVAGPISHIGFVVDDLERGARAWAETVGAGPFFALRDIAFDRVELSADDAAPTWEHSAAFGQWGSIAVELQELHTVSPPSLAEALTPPDGNLNHVAYIVDDPDAESARLEALGLPRVLFADNGGAQITVHRAPGFGRAIELHRSSDFVSAFFAAVARAAEGWDGARPLRDVEELGL